MRNNRSELSSSRSGQGGRRAEKVSVLANQKIGRRPRQSPVVASEGGSATSWRLPVRRVNVPLFHRLMLWVLHDSFWLLAVVGLSIKWFVELFTGDDEMRQNREQVAMEPNLDEWGDGEGEEQDVAPSPRRDGIEPWDDGAPDVAARDLGDFESMKMASLEAEEKELSEEELTDQAASLRSRVERSKADVLEHKRV